MNASCPACRNPNPLGHVAAPVRHAAAPVAYPTGGRISWWAAEYYVKAFLRSGMPYVVIIALCLALPLVVLSTSAPAAAPEP